jgi:hypothetical protein
LEENKNIGVTAERKEISERILEGNSGIWTLPERPKWD